MKDLEDRIKILAGKFKKELDEIFPDYKFNLEDYELDLREDLGNFSPNQADKYLKEIEFDWKD